MVARKPPDHELDALIADIWRYQVKHRRDDGELLAMLDELLERTPADAVTVRPRGGVGATPRRASGRIE